MKKIISLILSFLLILTVFCSCEKTPEENGDLQIVTNMEHKTEDTLRLAYSKTDTLDPFNSTMSANLQILGLIYDGLYKLDSSYEPVPIIAKSAAISGTSINVTLDSVVFSDGSNLTAYDVEHSFKLAKESPNYAERLKNFKSATVTASNIIMFTLEKSDPFAAASLTFPIVKKGSEGELPTGSGRYTVQTSGETVYLVVNRNKPNFNPVIKTITLVPVKDNNSVESSLEIGSTSFYYNDLSSGTYSRINANTVSMGINNFVYLVFNSKNEYFANPLIRRAINLAIDRKEIAATAFQGHARAAYSPFNPDWYKLESKDLVIQKDIAQAKELIAQSGIDITQKEISLLVNSENQFKLETAEFISDYLTALGFKVLLKNYTPEYYSEAIELESYDMYIGEIRLTHNMDLSPILGGNASYGIYNQCNTILRYAQLLEGKCELMDFINTFNEDLPFIALCYRNASVSYTNSLQAEFNCSDYDVFYDIETWSFK